MNDLYLEQGVKGRKESAGKYFMLECTPYPSVIIECGFLSNATDDRLLSSLEWQEKLSHAVAAGVVAYLSAFVA